MGRVLADEGVRGVRGRLLLASLVVGVDQVDARLPCLRGERITCRQRLVDADRLTVVVGRSAALPLVVEVLRREAREPCLFGVHWQAARISSNGSNSRPFRPARTSGHPLSIDECPDRPPNSAEPPDAPDRHRLVLPESQGGPRLDQALAAALPQYSRSRLAGWIRDGCVTINGSPAARRAPGCSAARRSLCAPTLPPDEHVLAERIPLSLPIATGTCS